MARRAHGKGHGQGARHLSHKIENRPSTCRWDNSSDRKHVSGTESAAPQHGTESRVPPHLLREDEAHRISDGHGSRHAQPMGIGHAPTHLGGMRADCHQTGVPNSHSELVKNDEAIIAVGLASLTTVLPPGSDAIDSRSADHATSCTGAEKRMKQQLRWRGTFIEYGRDEELGSPRACSEPDLQSERSSSHDLFFNRDRTYVDSLSDKLSSIWSISGACRRKLGDSSLFSDESLSTRDLVESRNLDSRRSGQPSGQAGSSSDVYIEALEEESVEAAATKSEDSDLAAAAAVVASVAMDTQKQLLQGLTKGELRDRIHVQTKAISENLRMQRRKQALTAIEELPEQLEEVLQQSATNLFGEVQDKVAVMSEMIRERETARRSMRIEKAVESLEVIPDIMWDSFESNLAKAKDVVRRRIDVMMKGLGGTSGATDDEIVQEMRALPAEVQQIAEEAIQAAVEETNYQAEQQFEKAMAKLPEEYVALRNAKKQMVAKVQDGAYAGTEHAARVAAIEPVEQAVAAVKNKEHGITGSVANQVVADTLLRAKAARTHSEDTLLEMSDLAAGLPRRSDKLDRGPRDCGLPMVEVVPVGSRVMFSPPREHPSVWERVVASQAAQVAEKINPGSIGHPELCPRPCLYYPMGQCVNGSECDFCHLPHPKRPSHLDKRHREMLRQLPFNKCAALVLPVLTEKVRAVDTSPETMRLLDILSKHCYEGCDSDNSAVTPFNLQLAQRSERQLVVALKSLSLRSLLTSLHRSVLPQALARRQAVDTLLQHLRYRSMKQELGAPAVLAGIGRGIHCL